MIANLPLAQASGMGLNAFFVYRVCDGFGLSYANALVLILGEGLVFILLTATGLRKKFSIPCPMRCALPFRRASALPPSSAGCSSLRPCF